MSASGMNSSAPSAHFAIGMRPKSGPKPSLFADTGRLFQELAERGAVVRACARCAAARGYLADEEGICLDYLQGIKITSLYDLAEMLKDSDRVISLSR